MLTIYICIELVENWKEDKSSPFFEKSVNAIF